MPFQKPCIGSILWGRFLQGPQHTCIFRHSTLPPPKKIKFHLWYGPAMFLIVPGALEELDEELTKHLDLYCLGETAYTRTQHLEQVLENMSSDPPPSPPNMSMSGRSWAPATFHSILWEGKLSFFKSQCWILPCRLISCCHELCLHPSKTLLMGNRAWYMNSLAYE